MRAASSWTIEETGEHAQRIGLAQGLCLDGRGWSDHPAPWSRSMLRDYLDTPEATSADIDWAVLDTPDIWESPLAQRHFDADLRREVLHLCRQRYKFVQWGAALPQTLCHHDLWPNNLFDYEGRTVIVDSAFAGAGWLGADIGNFVSDAALDLLRPAEELPALDRAVFAGYCAGLRAAGWSGDERAVRLGMCLMAAKWTWLIPVMLERARGDYQHTVYGSQGADADRLYAERATVFRMLVTWASEARVLAAELLGADAW